MARSPLARFFGFGRTVKDDEGTGANGLFFYRRTPSGEPVYNDTPPTVAAFFRGLNYICDSIGQMPWLIQETKTDGSQAKAARHPLLPILNVRPMGSEGGALRWRQIMLWRAVLYGNAYAEIQLDQAGNIAGLWPIHPDRVRVWRGPSDLIYEISNGRTGTIELPPSAVFHVRGFGDGLIGRPLIEFAASSIGWMKATEIFGASYFAAGLNPTSIIKTTRAMTPEAQAALRREYNRVYSGANGERLLVLDHDKEFQSVPVSAEAGQFMETRSHQVVEVCRWLGVPPHVVFDNSGAKYNGVEQAGLSIVANTLGRWMVTLEQEANAKLIRAPNRYRTDLDESALLRGDQAARSKYYREMVSTGLMSRNEARALEGLPPIDGGNEFLIPANMLPANERPDDETNPDATPNGPGSDQDPGAGGRPEE